MKVYFIGAGPGAADLITVRGLRIIQRAPVCLYAGSLVPEAVIGEAPGRVLDTASMTLEAIRAEYLRARDSDQDVARVHSGDPSLYGTIGEQVEILGASGIAYEIVPGVPSFAAAAAALGQGLTLPELGQSVILTRTATRASPMPEGEDLATLAQARTTMAIHLSINNLAKVVRTLTPIYGAACPCVVAVRVGWPDGLILRGTLGDIRAQVKAHKITRTALILVGEVLAGSDGASAVSKLYDPTHSHILRSVDKNPESNGL